jgi:hypothetical protein
MCCLPDVVINGCLGNIILLYSSFALVELFFVPTLYPKCLSLIHVGPPLGLKKIEEEFPMVEILFTRPAFWKSAGWPRPPGNNLTFFFIQIFAKFFCGVRCKRINNFEDKVERHGQLRG